ncbi:MAG TPA: dynamin family protein [Candidatus Baltobacteraceae bacterium]|nr:dynamin family protein [Candidatus Baltobacteraceae bacterium]
MIDTSALARYDQTRLAVLEQICALEALAGPEQQQVIAAARERLERATFLLAVVGEFSSGKSFLLNALLGRFRYEQVAGREQIVGLLATDINPSTATITELEYAPHSEAHAYHEDGRVERIPLDRLSQFVAVASAAGDAGAIHDALKDEKDAPSRVLVKVDSPFLRRGFSVADTPGLASINPAHRRATLQFLPNADAVLYLIDTQQPFTEGDASFLGIIRQHLDTIFIVQTKIDLWDQTGADGKAAWESAHERIAKLAAVHAPGTYVYALSARQFAEGSLKGDAALVERSRFPQFTSALDASLVRNSGRARLSRARDQAALAARDSIERMERDAQMLALGRGELERRRAQAQPQIAALQTIMQDARAKAFASSERMAAELREQGAVLAQDAERALTQAFDTADIAGLRDRARLHMLVDRTLGETVEHFASGVAGAVFADYERVLKAAQEQLPVRFSFGGVAAQAFGSSGQSSMWAQDPEHALCATIVLEAIGGPAIALVHRIATQFASAPPGSYMKRELTADLRASIWPEFRDEMVAFAAEIASQISDIAKAYANALEDAFERARDAAVGSIDRALQSQERSEGADLIAARMRESQKHMREILAVIDAQVDAFLARGEEIAAAHPGAEAVRRAHVAEEFDREAYQRGLRPQRWRVAVLGALRRGKSSLINAFAGHRVLADETAGEIAYPVHVRYGETEGAFALQSDGSWREIEVESALEEATRNPVLILTPWKLPRELVLVHAPAFDAGDSTLEDVCMVTARAASEVLCLFSRQLSDRELSLYERAAQLGKPMMFAHTLADNESSAERRHVVDLAQQYLRERAIPVKRMFTLSTLEYAQAKREQRAPAGWNELDALVSTIAAHAEEHMARLERLERAQRAEASKTVQAGEQPPAGKSRGFFSRWFSR